MWVSFFFGAGDEARTRYLDLGKVALYQMSYARKMVPQAGVEPATRGFSVRCSTNCATEANGDQEGARTLDLQRDRLAF